MGLGARDSAGHNLAGLRYKGLQQSEILVIDLLDVFCRKTAILASPRIATHISSPSGAFGFGRRFPGCVCGGFFAAFVSVVI